MEPGSDISQLDNEALRVNFDPGSLKRGTKYPRDDMADLIDIEPGRITGNSEGSGRKLYDVEVEWTTQGNLVHIEGSCTCPVGYNCKHCVALILTARELDRIQSQYLVAPTGSSSTQIIISGESSRYEQTWATESTALTPNPNWRRSLADIQMAHEGDGILLPLALEVDLSTTPRTRYNPNPITHVVLRPLKMGAKGKWIKTGVSWRELTMPNPFSLRSIRPSHKNALRSLAATCRSTFYNSEPTLSFRNFSSAVWGQLQAAMDAGVVLVPGPHAGSQIQVNSTPATLHIDLRADDHGSIAITPTFVEGEDIFDPATESVGLLGSPVHGMFSFDGTTVRLIPLDNELTEAMTTLVSGATVVVPSRDADEFLDEYAPVLARHGSVGSSDDSVVLTETTFDGLVLVIDRPSIDTAVAYWAARYHRGTQERTYLLGSPSMSGRNPEVEPEAIRALEFPAHLSDLLIREATQLWSFETTGTDTIRLLNEAVPWLIERGQVEVEIRGDLPALNESTAEPLISISVDDAAASSRSGTGNVGVSNDWFDLTVEVTVDGEHIEFVELFTALAMGNPMMVLDSGTWLRLDRPEFDRLRELIDEARSLVDSGPVDGQIRINRFQSSWWEELSRLGVVTRQSQCWAQSITRLAQAAAPAPIDKPTGLKADLRPYQQQGFEWLAFLHLHELGGILADDMGLGKTIQTLALFTHVKEHASDARFLVIAPTSVVENWHREAAQFAPDLVVQTIHETQKRRGASLVDAIGDADIVVTSYAQFRIDFDDYQSVEWNTAVMDEAQFVKNYKGKTYNCVRQLSARTKIAITGTPLENSLMDLWALLSITAPGLYPDPKRFSEAFRAPIESGRSPEMLATLRRRISPLMRRRTKGEVLTELPPKIESIVEVELGSKHARIYQTQLQRERQKVLGLVDDMQKNRFEILKSLTLLRQLSLDPGLVDDANSGVGSAKLDQLIEDVSQVVAEGHKALIFSQFTRFLTRVKARLDDAGIEYSYLDGRTRKRDQAISMFKDGDVPVFVISLKAGGFGLNLTEADYCFVLDPWWNPAVEAQAVDRTHRIGQQNQVMVYRYVSAGTIEEKVIELQQRKAALFSSVMDADGALSGALSAEDIRGLFD